MKAGILIAATACALAAFAPVTPAGQPPELLPGLQPRPNGTFAVSGIECAIVHKSANWAPAYLRDLILEEEPLPPADTTWRVRGSLKTSAGLYRLQQAVARGAPGTVSYEASFAGTPVDETKTLYLSLALPTALYKGQTIAIDRDECPLPWWFKGTALLRAARTATMLRIPLKTGGTLVVEGAMELYAQDNRAFGRELYDLQLFFTPHQGRIETASLALTFRVVPDTDPLAIAFDASVRRPPSAVAPVKPPAFTPDPVAIAASLERVKPLPLIRPAGGRFADPAGRPVRFWGMNLVAFYPDHALADQTADNLAALGINLVRPHHNLRPSTDWCPPDCFSLMTYDHDSRTPNLAAWDRFDYFNARLREKGVYLALSLHGTRLYLPEDNGILNVSAADDEAWAEAMGELNSWPWRKAFDPRKMLPLIDERCFLLNAEFTRQLLTHVNPYTGIAYGRDPQVLSLELVNEFASEYVLLCGNRFPTYWGERLQARFAEFSKQHGLPAFDLYAARKTPAQQAYFSAFCSALDETYARRLTAVVRETGCDVPVELSNLWRGDASLEVRTRTDSVIEDHAYEDPLAVDAAGTFLQGLVKSAVADRPFIVGEFNQSENPKLISERQSVHTMMVPAVAAYASLQDWSGIVWFAWCHGARNLAPDGWGKKLASRQTSIGDLAGDGPVLDHLRAAGIIFRNGYVSPSTAPVTLPVKSACVAGSYDSLMAGQLPLQAGWQSVHAFRKNFGTALPAESADAPWFKSAPPDPTVSDTGQVVRNAQRRQLTFAAPKAEGFSGFLDGTPPERLTALNLPGTAGFATVLVVSLDDVPLTESRKILVSRTGVAADGKETADVGTVALRLPGHPAWTMTVTRPASAAATSTPLTVGMDGLLALSATDWHECELEAR